jgi:hypothetical protein
MFYPNHQIRSYCIYLGSIEVDNLKLDMGVYEHGKGTGRTSHAIVCGEEDSNYMSGEFNLQNPKYSFQSWYYKINEILYKKYLEEK